MRTRRGVAKWQDWRRIAGVPPLPWSPLANDPLKSGKDNEGGVGRQKNGPWLFWWSVLRLVRKCLPRGKKYKAQTVPTFRTSVSKNTARTKRHPNRSLQATTMSNFDPVAKLRTLARDDNWCYLNAGLFEDKDVHEAIRQHLASWSEEHRVHPKTITHCGTRPNPFYPTYDRSWTVPHETEPSQVMERPKGGVYNVYLANVHGSLPGVFHASMTIIAPAVRGEKRKVYHFDSMRRNRELVYDDLPRFLTRLPASRKWQFLMKSGRQPRNRKSFCCMAETLHEARTIGRRGLTGYQVVPKTKPRHAQADQANKKSKIPGPMKARRALRSNQP